MAIETIMADDQVTEKVDEVMKDVNDMDENAIANKTIDAQSDKTSAFRVDGDVKLIARLIERTLKALLVQIGIAVRAKIRLQNLLESIRIKYQTQQQSSNNTNDEEWKNSQISFSTEDLIILQQFKLSPQKVLLANQNGIPIQIGNSIPNYHALERECMRYRSLTAQLIFIVDRARASLQSALPPVLEREAKEREEQRIRDEKAAAEAAIKASEEAEAKRIKDEEAAAAAAAANADQQKAQTSTDQKASDAIVIDDDEEDDDDDDIPLAGRTTGKSSADENAIDLTDESPALKTVNLPNASDSQANNPSITSSTSLPTDPAALLAQLTAAVSGSSNNSGGLNTSQPITIGGMENFDFSSFGLSNPSATDNDANKNTIASKDNLLDINMGMNDPNNTTIDDGLGDSSLFNFNSDQFEGVDLSFLNDLGGGSGAGGTGNSESDNNLLGNIDFSALLGGGGDGNGGT